MEVEEFSNHVPASCFALTKLKEKYLLGSLQVQNEEGAWRKKNPQNLSMLFCFGKTETKISMEIDDSGDEAQEDLLLFPHPTTGVPTVSMVT